tara:strand:+ start:219 stop:341 length:123 start_codon:yes stop_codon:yes gene_type:complete
MKKLLPLLSGLLLIECGLQVKVFEGLLTNILDTVVKDVLA